MMMSSRAINGQASFWLLVWTLNNIGVTLINKVAFAMVNFPYPYTLTAIHMAITWAACQAIFTSLGAAIAAAAAASSSEASSAPALPIKPTRNIWVRLLGDELLQPPPPTSQGKSNRVVVAAFSVLFTLNIAVGNASLQHVSVNFNQVMRSLVPVFTLWCSTSLLGHAISAQRRHAVWPVVIGVAMAVAGDRWTVTAVGFWTTLACVVLASAKVVASSELLTGPSYKMHPLRLLHRMALPAFIQCVVLAMVTGEARQLSKRWFIDLDPFTTGDWKPVTVVLISGVWAFSLNICALQAYKMTSALTCCIAAAVKQVLMIIVGTIMFQLHITRLNGIGIAIVLIASTVYSYVCIAEQAVAADKRKANNESVAEIDQGHDNILRADNSIDNTDEENGLHDNDSSDVEIAPLIASPAGNGGAVARR